MNTAVLHRKIAGVPVWVAGGFGATALIVWHYFHTPSVGGAATGTTPSDTDMDTGDPTAVDAGVPTQYGYNSGDTGGAGSGSNGDGSYADALASFGDALAGLTPPAPVDNSADFSAIEAMLGTIADQTAPDHSEDPTAGALKTVDHTNKAVVAHKATKVAKSQGGRVQPKASKKVVKKPAAAPKAVVHPKAVTVAHHAAPAPAPKPKAAPKPKKVVGGRGHVT